MTVMELLASRRRQVVAAALARTSSFGSYERFRQVS
jgi:hypothetical protein